MRTSEQEITFKHSPKCIAKIERAWLKNCLQGLSKGHVTSCELVSLPLEKATMGLRETDPRTYGAVRTINGFGEGEVAFFSAKRWDRRNRADLIESATPCHDAQVVGPYRDSNPLRLTILAAMSEDYTTAPQHLQTWKTGRQYTVGRSTFFFQV